MQNTIVNGEAMTASQENVLVVEQFLTENYLFRRNILNGKVEFAKKAEGDNAEPAYRPLTQEALNSIVLRCSMSCVTRKHPTGSTTRKWRASSNSTKTTRRSKTWQT